MGYSDHNKGMHHYKGARQPVQSATPFVLVLLALLALFFGISKLWGLLPVKVKGFMKFLGLICLIYATLIWVVVGGYFHI